MVDSPPSPARRRGTAAAGPAPRGAGGELAALRRLARLYEIQTSYADMEHKRVPARTESLVTVLRGLGAIEGVGDVAQATTRRLIEQWSGRLEPVTVAWDGELPAIELRVPARERRGRVECRLRLESGEIWAAHASLADLPVVATHEIEGDSYVALALPLRGTAPSGYHELTVETGGRTLRSRIVAAPLRAYEPSRERRWGVFLPLYALRSRRSWGVGDLTDLEGLAGWAAREGADFVGTLPLLASFLEEPFDPSPYAPVSRLFWNELFADPTRPLAPIKAPEATMRGDVEAEARRLNETELVPYREAMALKRRVLEEEARWFTGTPAGRDEMELFLRIKPQAADYARFRAAVEKLGGDWRRWPEHLRCGSLSEAELSDEAVGYWRHAQWRVDMQMRAASANARERGVPLYLDLPVGVHPDGYDAWRYQDQFVSGISVGAPPDIITTSGQNWGFEPLSPEALRQNGYDYVIAYLRHHLSVAGMLRVDHAMGLHRLYWIPNGAGAREGVYVRYRPEEMYAVLSLESHRHESVIVGENLGIVPDRVNTALGEHGVAKMYVLGIELKADERRPFRPIGRHVVASFGTHDLPTFAAFWQGSDLEERVRLGVLDAEREPVERAERELAKLALVRYLRREGLLDGEEDVADVYRGCLALLSTSAAERVLVNLEDLWLETRPQNIPGTMSDKHPNWRRRARYGLEELHGAPGVEEALAVVRRYRGARPHPGSPPEGEGITGQTKVASGG